MSQSVHVCDLIEKNLPREQNSYVPHIINSSCTECHNIHEFHKILENGATSTENVHLHSMFCQTPLNGHCGCRLCKPSGFTDITGPVELNLSTI